jgi:integrase
LGRLYDALAGDRLAAYFVVMAEPGLRLGGVDALTWADVDLDRGVVFIERAMKRANGGAMGIGQPKAARSRRGLELTARAAEELRRRHVEQVAERLVAGPAWTDDERWADLVSTSEVGTPTHSSNVRRSLKAACERAEVPVISPYGFRHTSTKLASAEGDRLDEIADQLGHTDTRMALKAYRHRPAVVRTAARADERRRATK